MKTSANSTPISTISKGLTVEELFKILSTLDSDSKVKVCVEGIEYNIIAEAITTYGENNYIEEKLILKAIV
jgi:hypothetical protein